MCLLPQVSVTDVCVVGLYLPVLEIAGIANHNACRSIVFRDKQDDGLIVYPDRLARRFVVCYETGLLASNVEKADLRFLRMLREAVSRNAVQDF